MQDEIVIATKEDIDLTVKEQVNERLGASQKNNVQYEKTKQDIDSEKKLKNLANSEKILLTVKTVFPLTLFPDTIIITKEKVTLKHKVFFFSESIHSILVKDIVNIEAQINILFGQIAITDRYFAQIPFTISFLWRSDALKVREIIQGLITSDRSDIDILNIDTNTLKHNLQKIGQASTQ